MTKSASAEVLKPEGFRRKTGREPADGSPDRAVGRDHGLQPVPDPAAAAPRGGEFLRASPSQVGFLPTIGQAGYALGVLLIVPLGDVLRRRGLLTFVLALLKETLSDNTLRH